MFHRVQKDSFRSQINYTNFFALKKMLTWSFLRISISAYMNIDDLARIYKSLSEPIRIRTLMLLVSGELCVCEIEEVLGEPQSKVSRHLFYLKTSGLISSRRSGKWMYYKIKDNLSPSIRSLIEHTFKIFKTEEWAMKDMKRLMEVKRRCVE